MRKLTENSEIDEGAVLVLGGEHKGRVGFYCLQNEQTYDMGEIARCSRCELTKGTLLCSLTHDLEIETGMYCIEHCRALAEHDLAVIYWDRPYGDDYSLVHPSELVKVPSSEYARYERECKRDTEKALFRLLVVLEKV